MLDTFPPIFSILKTVLSDSITYDVFGFTETRLDAGISPLYTLPAYKMFTNDRNRYGGGVAVFVSNRYTGCKLDECNRMETFIESVGVEVKCNGKLFIFICIYRPQGNVNYFFNTLNEILTIAKDRNYNEIFILGDINLILQQHNDLAPKASQAGPTPAGNLDEDKQPRAEEEQRTHGRTGKKILLIIPRQP